jgi:tryptophan-rich sensory protein
MSLAGARAALAPDNSLSMALWSLQIALNTLWSPVFFGLKNIKLGLIVLIALWLSVACTMLALWEVDWLSGLLFSPYLVWVSVAGALNASVWRLNLEENK